MDIEEFKKHEIKERFNIDDVLFGKIFVFIDFGNVNKWFDNDNRNFENKLIKNNEKISIDLEKLKQFINYFSNHARFYYGYDQNSIKFLGKAKFVFGENMVFTKPIQKIKHYLKDDEIDKTNRVIQNDNDGNFILLPKCNFDVEICVDAIRLMNKYDTFCIFSGDADFISLIKHLKNNRKKIILIKSGFVQNSLILNSDLIINAQDIKNNIAKIKQKSSF